MKRSVFVFILIFLVLIIDQSSKIWVKLNMAMYDEIVVFDWFRIHFTENPGMAFGLELGGDYGKLALSLFRIIAVFFIGYYLYKLVKKSNASKGLLAAIALILAGAIGNILDSMFYGIMFSESFVHGGMPATFLPDEGGYASFLHGKVVDMLYFPLVEGHYPEWFPFWGGERFKFFQPVFNIADTAISIGVVMIILFYRRFFNNLQMTTATDEGSLTPPSTNEDDNNKRKEEEEEERYYSQNYIDESPHTIEEENISASTEEAKNDAETTIDENMNDILGDPSAVAAEDPDEDK